IQRREFDPKRELEYYSRIVLGVVAGGTVMLLIENVSDGTPGVHISAAALGLLAGYNTDFLFSAIERITAAILPWGPRPRGARRRRQRRRTHQGPADATVGCDQP